MIAPTTLKRPKYAVPEVDVTHVHVEVLHDRDEITYYSRSKSREITVVVDDNRRGPRGDHLRAYSVTINDD
jgi:hypothetical protein